MSDVLGNEAHDQEIGSSPTAPVPPSPLGFGKGLPTGHQVLADWGACASKESGMVHSTVHNCHVVQCHQDLSIQGHRFCAQLSA
jgi:hypothetical protein